MSSSRRSLRRRWGSSMGRCCRSRSRRSGPTSGRALPRRSGSRTRICCFLSSLLLIGGAAGDRFGIKRVFAIGIGLFVVASMVCAIAPTPLLLIIARAVQGAGAALMVPGSLSIIAAAYPREQRGWAIGIWAAASSLTTILGPIIGGFLLTTLGDWSWRLVFAVNLPLGGISLALLLWRVPNDQRGRETTARSRRRRPGHARPSGARLGAHRRRQQRQRAADEPRPPLVRCGHRAARRVPLLGGADQRADDAALALPQRQLLGRERADLRALFGACRRRCSICR